jgi:hypothetical protein
MTLTAAIGIATGIDGRESALQATHQALQKLGNLSPILGIVFATQEYGLREVANGVGSLLGQTPFVGMSTTALLSPDGLHSYSVLVALLASTTAQAEAIWMPGYAQSAQETAQRLNAIVERTFSPQALLLFADGFSGNIEQLCNALSLPHLAIAGGLSSGNPNTLIGPVLANLFQGSGALSAALLRGNLHTGIGYAHGWQSVGKQFRITRSRGFWLRTLDGRPASEAYAQLFGYAAREWAFPPLNTMARLYPLGMLQGEKTLVRSPIRVEADGSFRFNLSIEEGSDALLLLGSQDACRQALLDASLQARQALGNSRPAFVLLLVDQAWNLLLRAFPGFEVKVIQEVFGKEIPIAGAYTLGQIVPSEETPSHPQALNQHVVVMAFGE